MRAILIAGLLAAFVTPAAAQNSFRVGAVEFTTALPAGYCAAEGKNAAVAQMLAAADNRNVTHLTAMSCDADKAWKDYFILKTPNELLAVTTDTAELQRAMGPGFNAQSGGDNEEASKSVSRTIGSPVQIKGKVRGYGQDANCVYLGAVLDMAAPERGIAYTLAMGGCMRSWRWWCLPWATSTCAAPCCARSAMATRAATGGTAGSTRCRSCCCWAS